MHLLAPEEEAFQRFQDYLQFLKRSHSFLYGNLKKSILRYFQFSYDIFKLVYEC